MGAGGNGLEIPETPTTTITTMNRESYLNNAGGGDGLKLPEVPAIPTTTTMDHRESYLNNAGGGNGLEIPEVSITTVDRESYLNNAGGGDGLEFPKIPTKFPKIPTTTVDRESPLNNAGDGLEIPPELMIEILSRVPAKPLLRFRSACKQFLSLIDDPTARYLHASRSIRCRSNFHLLITAYNKTTSQLFILSAAPHHGGVARHLATIPDSPAQPNELQHLNGLVLLHTKNGMVMRDFVHVLNPTTRQIFKLPGKVAGPRYSRGNTHMCNMFGFDEFNNEYKILSIRLFRVLDEDKTKVDFAIFSLSSYTWRNIHLEFPFGLRSQTWFTGPRNGVCVRGVIYFMVVHINVIYAFDLRDERLSAIPAPPEARMSIAASLFNNRQSCKCNLPYLIKLNESPGIVCHEHVIDQNLMVVWTLEDCHNQLWVKHTIVFPAPWETMGLLYPCGSIHTGELVFTPQKSSSEVVTLCFYNLETRKFRFAEVGLVDKCLFSDDVEVGQVINHAESMMPLKKNENKSRFRH